jgi:hypothetical protein
MGVQEDAGGTECRYFNHTMLPIEPGPNDDFTMKPGQFVPLGSGRPGFRFSFAVYMEVVEPFSPGPDFFFPAPERYLTRNMNSAKNDSNKRYSRPLVSNMFTNV